MENSIKNTLINNYLQDQVHCSKQSDDAESNKNKNALCQYVEMPDNDSLEEFKNQVRAWVEIDNNIKALKNAIKERNVAKKELTDRILRFMIKFNIEDLNTKDGSKLRYKVNQVKKNPTAKDIKTRLADNYNNAKNAEELSNRLFQCDMVEKPSLRRLKN